MKFKPEFNNYRESPWILILPETGRMEHSIHNNGLNNNNKDNRKNRMSFGIHHLVAKNNALNSATWPRPKMKKSKSRCTSNDEDDRPKTATLEHPKILDIAFLGKIDMTSLSKKSLMSIANLCILPVKQESKRNGVFLYGGRGAKTRRYTPIRSPSPRVKKAIRFLSSDKETNSENEDARSQIIQSPTKTVKSQKIPVKTRGSISSEKSVDSDKEMKKSTSRLSVRSKNVEEVFGCNSNIPVPCMTCGRSDQPERLHSHPAVPRSILKTPVPATPRSEVVKSSVRKPVPIRYRSETKKREEVTVKSPEKKKETVSRIPEMRRKERTPEPELRKKEIVVEKSLEPEIRRRDILIRTPDPEIKRKDILLRTPEPEVRKKDISIRTPEPEVRKKDISIRTPEPEVRRKDISIRTPEPEVRRKDILIRTPEPEVRRKEVVVRTPEPEIKRKDSVVVRTPEPRIKKKEEVVPKTPEPRLKKKEEGEEMQNKGNVRGPRTLMCYICGRSFGTASFPLHEPQCLQRWQRENALLAPHLQRPPPQKPDSPLTSEEWNKMAFEASQSQLISCVNCGRTFNPDRLEVHLRSCRPGAKRFNNTQSQEESTSSEAEEGGASSGGIGGGSSRGGGGPPPAVYCYICGRMFGTKSIAIHEPKCMEKWRNENEQLPSHQRRPEPIKPEPVKQGQHNPVTPAQPPASRAPPPEARPPENSRKRGRTVPCYLCGREFGTSSINIHEPQCLKKWKLENEKLPKAKQRPEPEKPDIVYNAAGQIDFQGTMDAIWETHLTQLVPCKHCGRTFNPDRVDIHERSCKGPAH